MTGVNPTLEVYKASAGSGKTYQLAYKYICLLLGERTDDGGHLRLYTHKERRVHREILAITFTNKATEEMKQRIIKELFLLSDPRRKSNYRAGLMKSAGADAETLARAAREALTSLLFDFGGMQVSTIDAFFQRVLRSFAYEADLSGNYELMLDNKLMIQMAIADTLTMVCGMRGTTAYDRRHISRIRNWIGEMIDSRLNSAEEIKIFDKTSSIRNELVKFIENLSDESYQAKSGKINEFFKDEENISRLLKALRAKLKEIDADIEALAADILAEGDGALNKNARAMLERICGLGFSELTDTNMQYVSGARTEYEKLFLKNKPYSADLFDKLAMLFGRTKMHFTVELILKQMFSLGLFHEVLEVAHRMKVHLNTIMLSDTNMLLNSIIADSDTPFIYERTGQRLRNFLIDEFQDTSRLQWLNLRPLVSNSLSNGGDNMIIGDVKQCIYRFRNSYPGLLDNELQADGELNYAICLQQMGINWRSAGEIVDFNSRLFARIGEQVGAQSYASVGQRPQKDAHSGYVDIAAVAEFPDDAFARMVEHMRRQLDSGYRAGDIVVLVRWNREGERVVERLLAETVQGGKLEGVQVLSDEALFVRSSKAVQFIVAKLRELDMIRRDPAEIPVSPRTGLPKTTENEMQWLRETLDRLNASGNSGEDNLEELLAQFDARNHLAAPTPEEDAAWRERTRGRSVFEIVEELITRLPVDDWRVSEAQFIAAFQDLVADYCRMNAPSVHGFLALWDERLEEKAAIGMAEGTDAIRVLTIHKSKGLEFECVHVPLLSGAMDAIKGFAWYESEEIFKSLALGCETPAYFPLDSSRRLECTDFAPQYRAMKTEQKLDELNALYVALTRAKTELIVSVKDVAKKGGAANTAAELIRDALMADGNSLSESGWHFTAGTPTVKRPKEGRERADETERFSVGEYRVYDRLDIWHNTRPAEETDSGDML